MIMRKIVLAALLSIISTVALAQSGVAVKQSGNITPNTVPAWFTNGVIGGGVTSADSPISSFGVTNNGGNGICLDSQRITAAGRQALCLSVSDSGPAKVSLQNYGTDTAQALQLCQNGTCFSLNGSFAGLVNGSTSISGGTNTYVLQNNAGALGQVSPSITVNGAICTLGGSCVESPPLVVGTTGITNGTSGRIEYNNAGVLGELATTGSGGNVVLATAPTITSANLVTPAIGVATGTSLTIGPSLSGIAAQVGVGSNSANSIVVVGQDTTHFVNLFWTYNATAGSATASLNTAGYNNPLNIDASAINIGTLNSAAVTITNSGVAPTGTGASVRAISPIITTPALKGSTSGNLTLNCAAICGNNTLTFPGASFDFSASGGSNQFVKQTSSGGAFSVAAIAAADLPLATTSAFGAVKPDNATITIAGGVLTASGGSATTITIGTTTITTGTSGSVLYQNGASPTGTIGQIATNGTGNVLLAAGTLNITTGKTAAFSNSITMAGTDSTTMTFPGASATITQTIASGATAMGTGAIGSAACATVVTATATNTATTDVLLASFNGDPTAVTGYVPLTSGMLTIIVYPTTNTANFKVCNNTGASITPGAITLNWRVVR